VAAHLFIVALFLLPFLAAWLGAKNHPFLFYLRFRLDNLELASVDYRIRLLKRAAVNPKIVFLAIDEASATGNASDEATIRSSPALTLMHSRGYPYPRQVYAEICDRLLGAGAKVVAFDILFWIPRPDEDPAVAAALAQYDGSFVIGTNFSDDSAHGLAQTLEIPPPTILANQDLLDNHLGYVNFWPDPDGVVREAQYRTNLENVNGQAGAEKLPKLYSLDARAVANSGEAALVPDDLHPRMIRYADRFQFSSFPLYTIFEPDIWSTTFRNGGFFKDKIVLVGPKGDWAKDQLVTPLGLWNGAEIHLCAMNALLQHDFLQPALRRTIFSITVAAGLLSFLLAMGVPSVGVRFAAGAAVLAGYLAALAVTYDRSGWLLPAVAPLTVFGGASGVGYVYDFVLLQLEKLQLRKTFERYTSPNVAKYLLDHSESYKAMLTGTRKPVTILFSDVRGFTSISEESDSHELVAKLNEYLTAMVACVFRHDGALDKFIGDAVMAVWGNTPYNFGEKEDAVRAVRAALDMQVELRRLNDRWKAQGGTAWQIGIGINHGPAIVGDMGSQQRKEFAVLGDAVNLASRLESLTKEYKVDILLGEGAAELVRHAFHLQTVDLIQVAGKKQAVETYTVLGDKTEPLPPGLQEFLHLYEAGIAAFRKHAFAEAKAFFERALELQPENRLAKQYAADCEALILTPPDSSWTGVRVMTKK
jgi:adenylate cyclase